jgi:prepilin-type N-terminal cleavage/methylation domain-containing protein
MRRGFTLIETVMAIALFGLLAGAIYAVANAALDATRATMDDQASQEKLEAFVRATRNAIAGLPAGGEIFLRFDAGGKAGTPELVFRGKGRYFGMPLIGGGEVVLAAPAMADGTRTFSLVRLPPETSQAESAKARAPGNWLRVLPRVEKVQWEFFSNGEWKIEWPEGSGRPQLVRLRFVQRDEPEAVIELMFWLPPLSAGPPAGEAAPPAIEGVPAP